MIVVSGTVRVVGADRAVVLAHFDALVAATHDEPGCITFDVWEDPHSPGRFRLFEEWTTDDAVTNHNGAPHLRAFFQALIALGGLQVDFCKYRVSDVGPLR